MSVASASVAEPKLNGSAFGLFAMVDSLCPRWCVEVEDYLLEGVAPLADGGATPSPGDLT
jgi:hypothetical protein